MSAGSVVLGFSGQLGAPTPAATPTIFPGKVFRSAGDPLAPPSPLIAGNTGPHLPPGSQLQEGEPALFPGNKLPTLLVFIFYFY